MTKIIGILNYTANSFSDGGKYNDLHAAKIRIKRLFQQGANIVDIGACSTSYGAKLCKESEELEIIKPLLKGINLKNISIDTYNYCVMKHAILAGIKCINDVSGGKNPEVLDLIAANQNVNYICMYSLTLPADKKIRVKSVNEVYDWIGNKIIECEKHGIAKRRLIIDPGIGFVTDEKQSWEIIKNIEKIQQFGIKVCIGHSRKSFFKVMTKYIPTNRDIETTAMSLYMLLKRIDYVRVHNVAMHRRAFEVFDNLLG